MTEAEFAFLIGETDEIPCRCCGEVDPYCCCDVCPCCAGWEEECVCDEWDEDW